MNVMSPVTAKPTTAQTKISKAVIVCVPTVIGVPNSVRAMKKKPIADRTPATIIPL